MGVNVDGGESLSVHPVDQQLADDFEDHHSGPCNHQDLNGFIYRRAQKHRAHAEEESIAFRFCLDLGEELVAGVTQEGGVAVGQVLKLSMNDWIVPETCSLGADWLAG